MKKIGVIFLALTLLILDLTLLGAFPLLTQDGKFSLVEQIGYGVWAVSYTHLDVYKRQMLSSVKTTVEQTVVFLSVRLLMVKK